MSLPLYLAMTGAEFAGAQELPKNPAWMACHFSCYGTGLSNLPTALPEGALLIVNDRTPICGHDADRIAQQLAELVWQFGCSGVLLDFQRPGVEETASLCTALTQALECPIGVTEAYADGLTCCVFLASLPPGKCLSQHAARWNGREIWLETVTDGRVAVVTEDGCQWKEDLLGDLPDPWFSEEDLHCRYHWQVDGKRLVVTLRRTKEEIPALLDEANSLGITRAIGLYQQLKEDRPG